ncbi:hypothetical protein QE454_000937 [Microbacterium sp. SORGH_AS454]|nr:hypothetical protein [Microbacterium sp. SORGH_AS_0454]
MPRCRLADHELGARVVVPDDRDDLEVGVILLREAIEGLAHDLLFVSTGDEEREAVSSGSWGRAELRRPQVVGGAPGVQHPPQGRRRDDGQGESEHDDAAVAEPFPDRPVGKEPAGGGSAGLDGDDGVGDAGRALTGGGGDRRQQGIGRRVRGGLRKEGGLQQRQKNLQRPRGRFEGGKGICATTGGENVSHRWFGGRRGEWFGRHRGLPGSKVEAVPRCRVRRRERTPSRRHRRAAGRSWRRGPARSSSRLSSAGSPSRCSDEMPPPRTAPR